MDVTGSKSRSTAAIAGLLVLLTCFAWSIKTSEARAQRALEDRVEQRVTMASDFLQGFTGSLLRREAEQAAAWLGGPRVSRERFEDLTEALDFSAAVLLDRRGVVLAVFPHRADLVGKDLSGAYDHLDAALEGRPTVSNVVASAAQGVPVVGLATPYGTERRERVFSGAFAVHSSPIGRDYLRSVVPIAGAESYVVDAEGGIVTASSARRGGSLTSAAPELATALEEAESGHHSRGATGYYFSSEPIPGTPWRFVATVSTDALYAPLAGAGRLVPWTIFAAFALSGCGVLWFMKRTRRQNRELTAKNYEVEDLARRLEELSLIDPMTGVANRRGFETLVDQQMKLARREGLCVHALFVDVDGMKSINDTFGHSEGDRALGLVAQVLRAACRDADVVARLGGDEFAVAMTNGGDATIVVRRISAAIEDLEAVQRLPYALSVTIGVATHQPGDVWSLEVLLASADEAMYARKRDRTSGAARG
ncbi:MAG TPA: sensor domain-containing diguanylate cyclase [Actinomycetota bacterium]|nr:sensor domain-containing diguanylate cyclase [Actinomycetota bacterium]